MNSIQIWYDAIRINILLQQCKDHQYKYQILFSDEAEDEAIDSTKLVLCIDHVKHGQHPLNEKNLEIVHASKQNQL